MDCPTCGGWLFLPAGANGSGRTACTDPRCDLRQRTIREQVDILTGKADWKPARRKRPTGQLSLEV